MPSLLNMLKTRPQSCKNVVGDVVFTGPVRSHTFEKDTSRPPRARSRSVASTSQSAACRGLYTTTKRRSTNRQRSKTRSAHFGKSGQAPTGSEDNDPIVKCSLYPQMVGKRMSELQRAPTIECDRAAAQHRVKIRSTHHQPSQPLSEQRSSRRRRYSIESELSYDSEYSSDGNPEGRPVRVCMYPQAKYIKEPTKLPSMPSSKPHRDVVPSAERQSSEQPSAYTSYRNFKRSSLPADEYQILVRRQKMQRAREVLEPLFAQQGPQQRGIIWHGLKQPFTVRNSQRRHISKVRYAVRKALQNDLDLADGNFKLAICRHSDHVYFCELSDVDGLPIPQTMIDEFTGLYQNAKDNAYVARLARLQHRKPVQHTWSNDRVRQAAVYRRVDSVIAVGSPTKRPELVSRFSWDSYDDEQMGNRNRLTKVKQ